MTEILDPSYYKGNGDSECQDVIEDFNLNHARGNIVAYVLRAGKKSPGTEISDLCKARNFLNREINRLRGIRSFAFIADEAPPSPDDKPRARIAARCSRSCDQPGGFAA